MSRERGGGPNRSVGECVLRCPRRGRATAATRAQALLYAHWATFQGLVRLLSPA
jgi:hypothetical protein